MKSTALFAAALFAASSVHADTLTFNDSYDGWTEFASSGSSNPLEVDPTVAPLSLSMFDSALGTLTGVTLTVGGGYDSNGTMTNNNGETVNVRATQTIELNYDIQNLGANGSFAASDNTGFVSLAPNASADVNLAANDSQTLTLGAGDDLSDFIGAAGSTFLIDFYSIVETAFTGGGGNLDFAVETMGNIFAEVSYSYDAAPVSQVPLPASLPLILAGLGGLGLVSRRKRRA